MQPYAATQKISARAAWSASTTSGVIRLASTTGNPSSSALALTGDGSNFLPRPRTASGRVTTSAISFPASTSEVNEGTAKSGVPINTIRIMNVSPQQEPRRLQITAESQSPAHPQKQFNMNKYTQNQRKSRNKSSSLNKPNISEDAPPWPNGTRARRARKRSPWGGAHTYRPARSFAAKRECLSTG